MTNTTITCIVTGETKKVSPNKDGSPRLPRGWKSHKGRHYSSEAWKSLYVMRAVSIPVQSVFLDDAKDGDLWPKFCAAIHACWKETTLLSNHVSSRLYSNDITNAPYDSKTKKLPKLPSLYLYPESSAIAPLVSGTSRSSICQQVEANYRTDRFAIRTGTKSLRSYRYPQPLPITNQGWTLKWAEEKKLPTPLIFARLGGDRWTLKMRNDQGSRRAIQLLCRDDVMPTAIAIEARRIGSHKGLPTLNIRDAGGQNVRHFVSVRIACWIPRESQKQDGTLYVHTDRESLLVAMDEKDRKLRVWHRDDLQRLVRERDRRKQRLSDDRKAEERPVASFQSRSTSEVAAFRRKMSDACHQISAQVANLAKRRRFATIQLNDAETSYIDHFPWFELRDKIRQKCERSGIAFMHAPARKTEQEVSNG